MNVPHHKQELPYSCLPACVRMVLDYYGELFTESELRILLKTRMGGTSPVQAMLKLPQLGFDADVNFASQHDLRQYLASDVPCIVHLWTEFLPHWEIETVHAVVVTGMSDEQVTLLDPDNEPVVVSVTVEAFMQAWSATDYLAIIIQPHS